MVVKALITHSKAALLWCFLAGASLPLAFAPFNFFLLAYFAPLVLFYYWSAASPKRAALMGFLFGLGLGSPRRCAACFARHRISLWWEKSVIYQQPRSSSRPH